MRFFAAVFAFAYGANALATTKKDCRDESHSPAIVEKNCRTIWYSKCIDYTMPAGETCNFITLGDSSVSYFSRSLEVQMLGLEKQDVFYKQFPNGRREPFDEEHDDVDSKQYDMVSERECLQASDVPTKYLSETMMIVTGSKCGYKYQVANHSPTSDYSFTFMTSGAQGILA